eukprot:CAMPEP_0178406336 /NCGR_PEP_ID=MMETSP0689_2-20121128/18860_1 /TAXON_ID=160604 /ORGANISM="Amphidinium massartii, Strain CS-259" /LENGTH=719 /DNA_ID=CAMNT_0020027375 /DNA_START=57 /DNA_END=2212 /DNA_ORIENTATION=+
MPLPEEGSQLFVEAADGPPGDVEHSTAPKLNQELSLGARVASLERKLATIPLMLASSQPTSSEFEEHLRQHLADEHNEARLRRHLTREINELRMHVDGQIAAEATEFREQLQRVQATTLAQIRNCSPTLESTLAAMREEIVGQVLARTCPRISSDNAAASSSSSSLEGNGAVNIQALDPKFGDEAAGFGEATARREFRDSLKEEQCEWARLSQAVEVERARGKQCLEALRVLETSVKDLTAHLKRMRPLESDQTLEIASLTDRIQKLESQVDAGSVADAAFSRVDEHIRLGHRIEALEKAEQHLKESHSRSSSKIGELAEAVAQMSNVSNGEQQLQDQEAERKVNEVSDALRAKMQTLEDRLVEVCAEVHSGKAAPSATTSSTREDIQLGFQPAEDNPPSPVGRLDFRGAMETPIAVSIEDMRAAGLDEGTSDDEEIVSMRRSLSLQAPSAIAFSQSKAACNSEANRFHPQLQRSSSEAFEKNLNRLARSINATLRQMQEQGEVTARSPSPMSYQVQMPQAREGSPMPSTSRAFAPKHHVLTMPAQPPLDSNTWTGWPSVGRTAQATGFPQAVRRASSVQVPPAHGVRPVTPYRAAMSHQQTTQLSPRPLVGFGAVTGGTSSSATCLPSRSLSLPRAPASASVEAPPGSAEFHRTISRQASPPSRGLLCEDMKVANGIGLPSRPFAFAQASAAATVPVVRTLQPGAASWEPAKLVPSAR